MAGIMMVYWIDFGFSNLGEGVNKSFIWRAPTILQCVFLIPMIFIIWIIPETPRWLAARDRNEEALEVLSRLNKGKMTEDGIRAVHCDIVNTVALERSIGTGSWGDLLKNDSESLCMNELVRMVFAYSSKVSKADGDSLSLVVSKHSSSSVESMRLYVCATLLY